MRPAGKQSSTRPKRTSRERRLVLDALKAAAGNVAEAACRLGLSRPGLIGRIAALALGEEVRASKKDDDENETDERAVPR